METLFIVAGVAVVLILIGAGCAAVRGGYASAPYRLVRSQGKFQVRDYPALVLVQTPMQATNGSFMRLFHYIDRQNSAQQKISMTTPVFMTRGPTNDTMAFVLPAGLALDRAPKPADETVNLQAMPAGRFAVLRFSGGRNARREAAALDDLQNWLQQESLTPAGGPIYGYFDPPWTPSFLRRNEVMLRLAN
jgi:DNA gyrase inhibitor GyrI